MSKSPLKFSTPRCGTKAAVQFFYILCEKLTGGLMMHLNDNQLDIDLSLLLKSNIKGVLNSL